MPLIRRLKILGQFLGANVIAMLCVSACLGVALFFVEIGFAAGIQLFVLVLGIASPGALKLPRWLPPAQIEWVLVFLFSCALVRNTGAWLQDYLKTSATEKFKFRQRTRILEWTFQSQSVSSSKILSLFGEKLNHAGGVVKYLQILLVQLTTSLLLGLYLLRTAPLITAGAFMALVAIGLPLRILVKKVRNAGLGTAAEWDRAQGRLVSAIKNLLLLRIYGLEANEQRKTTVYIGAHLKHTLSYNRNAGILSIVPQLFGTVLICSIAYFVKARSLMPPGALLSYFYLFIRSVDNLSSISTSLSNFIFEIPQFKDQMIWWKETYLPIEKKNSQFKDASLSVQNYSGQIKTPIAWTVSALRFSYETSHDIIFEGLNMNIPAGSTVAVVGPSGAGKSTLLGLLLGELTPQNGRIEVEFDGIKNTLSAVKTQVLHNIGYVGPESFLLEGTIYQNLIYGLRHKPDPNDVAAAIENSECQFIYDMPKGLDHEISEQGQGLSAGQKQRLSLARALLRKPKALILDEATANLDLETEDKLVDTLAKLKGQITLIVVTHRAGLLRIADNVLKLN